MWQFESEKLNACFNQTQPFGQLYKVPSEQIIPAIRKPEKNYPIRYHLLIEWLISFAWTNSSSHSNSWILFSRIGDISRLNHRSFFQTDNISCSNSTIFFEQITLAVGMDNYFFEWMTINVFQTDSLGCSNGWRFYLNRWPQPFEQGWWFFFERITSAIWTDEEFIWTDDLSHSNRWRFFSNG